MNFKKKIQKILNLKIPWIQSGRTKNYWVFKLTVEQVFLIFEAGHRSCFGLFQKRNYNRFISEYNLLFNKGNLKLNESLFKLKLFTKHLLLQAMYNSLLYSEGKNAKIEFKRLFNEDYSDINQISRVTDENNRILDKLQILKPPVNVETITFSELIAIVENSRGIVINRNLRLMEFKNIYDLEVTKWQT